MSGGQTTLQRGMVLARAALTAAREVPRRTGDIVRAVAFWLAIALPALYLPFLFVETAWAVALVSVLLVVHILAVLVGSGHEPNL